jgi:putative peptidoglycan lipid II flippase
VPAFTPVFLNLVLIGAAIWLSPLFAEPIFGLAVGVFVAGLVQLGFQLPYLRAIGLLPRPRWGWNHPGVRKIGKLMLPAILGSSVAQINLIVDRIIASFLVTGSISWLYYSDRLLEFPLGIFAIALATVILPGLSRRHAEQSMRAFSATLDWALKLVAVIALPAAVGMFMLAGPMLATLFQYGEFTAADTRMASLSLMAYSVALVGFTLVKVLSPGYFSRQDTRTPVRVSIRAMIVNIVLNVAIVVPMVHRNPRARTPALPPPPAWRRSTTRARFITACAATGSTSRATAGACSRFACCWPMAMAIALWLVAGPLDGWLAAAWHAREPAAGRLHRAGLVVYLVALPRSECVRASCAAAPARRRRAIPYNRLSFGRCLFRRTARGDTRNPDLELIRGNTTCVPGTGDAR